MLGFFLEIYKTGMIPIKVNNNINVKDKVTECEKQRI
jgi:hypothetical protein